MKKEKIIKKTVYKTVLVEVEEKYPTWYYRFLLWLFGHEERNIERSLREERQHAWDKGYSDAINTAHHYKEEAMQKKLSELGYDVKCNFPIARMNPKLMPTEKAFDPRTAWEIVLKSN